MNGLIKHREIRFSRWSHETTPAHSACLVLKDIEGILQVQPVESLQLQLSYDVSRICLSIIDEVLVELGFHLDNTLLHKLKRALYYYTEETQRANLGLEGACCADKQMFINRYLRRQHGCRDERPEHWRNYR